MNLRRPTCNSVVMGARKTSRDQRLLRQVASGSPSALRSLYDRHARKLAARLRQRGATTTEIEEVLQDTFLAAWRTADRYRGDGDVGAWLWGIAHRQHAMSVRRSISRRRVIAGQHTTPTSEEDWVAAIEAGDQFARLEPELRATVEAVALDGLSLAEASQRLGVPEGTVKSRMHRARRRIEEAR